MKLNVRFGLRSYLIWLVGWVASGIVMTCAGAAPSSPPATKEIRNALTRSLNFLGKTGDQWVREKDCMSCHHLPTLVWSHVEAERRGIPVDSKKLDTWLQWSAERVAGKNPGIETLSQFVLALPQGRAGLPGSLRTSELAGLILAAQEPDGSWKPGSQFASMQKRQKPEAQEASTRLNVLALASVAVAVDTNAPARARALSWLAAHHEVPLSTETLVFRLLLAQRLKETKAAEAGRDQLLELQHADGGWSWRLGEAQSDALATGQVLYALRGVTAKRVVKSVARGRQWLLANQRETGEWFTKSTLITALPGEGHIQRTDGIYTFWGTAWATLGLLEALPLSPKPVNRRSP
jgi:hypothetical protein